MGLGVDWAVKWLNLSAEAMAEHRVELIELDRAIGDADHGENMDRGFQAVLQKLNESPPETAGAALKAAATLRDCLPPCRHLAGGCVRARRRSSGVRLGGCP